jgi:hypothetical protein
MNRIKAALAAAALVPLAAGCTAVARGAAPAAPAPVGTPAYTTGYSYYDNTPPGSAAISNPVLHRTAGGTGTYADPVTLAVGHSKASGKDVLDYPAGTRFYIPNIRKYTVVEDTCGDGSKPQNGPCHVVDKGAAKHGATVWVDVWVGGQHSTRKQSDACMSKLTDGSTDVHTVIRDPAPDYLVVPGDISNGAVCNAGYGNTALTVTASQTPTPTPTQPTGTPSPTVTCAAVRS